MKMKMKGLKMKGLKMKMLIIETLPFYCRSTGQKALVSSLLKIS